MKALVTLTAILVLTVVVSATPEQLPLVPSQCMTAVPSADDFVSDYTGPASDIRFWYAWRGDVTAPINSLRVAIHEDDGGKPGTTLWEQTFTEWQTTQTVMSARPFYICPMKIFPEDHLNSYQVDLLNIPNPYVLTSGQLYWLELQADVEQTPGLMPAEMMGWRLHGAGVKNNPAMWYFPPPQMGGNPEWVLANQKYSELGVFDLAFNINPEPATLVLLSLGVLALGRRSRRK